MDLGSRTKMVDFEPVDATPAPAEPERKRRAGRVRNAPEEIAADNELIKELLEATRVDAE